MPGYSPPDTRPLIKDTRAAVSVKYLEEFIRELREQACSAREVQAPQCATGNVGHVRAETLEAVALDLAAMVIAFSEGE